MGDTEKTPIKEGKAVIKDEDGMALVVTLLLLLLMTALGMGAIMLSSTDSALSGNYRVLKTGAAAADSALTLP